MDLFGRKAAKKSEELQQQLVKQSETFEVKLNEIGEMSMKAAKDSFLNAVRNFNTQIFPHYNSALHEKAYQNSDDLNSVVSRIANAAAAIPFYPELEDGSDVSDNDKIFEFLKTFTLEQRIAAYSYLLIHGEIFAYKDKLENGINAGLRKLHILNPANVTVYIERSFPVEIKGFTYWDNVNGISIDIKVEDMLFVKLFNPDEDVLQQVRGLAPVKVLKKRLERNDASLDISIAQMQNGGLPGIIHDKTPGVEASVIGARKDNFGRFLSNSANTGAPYFSAGDLGYIPIGSTLADMNLAELSSIDLDKICNVYHVSSTEFNNKSSSTESNVKTHSKSFYTNGVLPLVCLLRDGLNTQVVIDIKTKAVLAEDYSDIPELQPDMKAMADALAAMPVMIPNAALEKMGEKRIEDDENMNKVYIKNGYSLLEDVAISIDSVDNEAGDYQDGQAQVVPLKQAK